MGFCSIFEQIFNFAMTKYKESINEQDNYTIQMARHDAPARDGNGDAKDGLGGAVRQ